MPCILPCLQYVSRASCVVEKIKAKFSTAVVAVRRCIYCTRISRNAQVRTSDCWSYDVKFVQLRVGSEL